jgi:hypothetical protein
MGMWARIGFLGGKKFPFKCIPFLRGGSIGCTSHLQPVSIGTTMGLIEDMFKRGVTGPSLKLYAFFWGFSFFSLLFSFSPLGGRREIGGRGRKAFM